ncbi:hypothetical protein TrVE_jg10003 [Triparma verrucosa]|uniref:PAS domain-containing protein n=1 Tax=Triparma verrucosa TaxID=1606542 RepID=A0A9W7FNN1_9STRA|nr:hypothetical protein TrVE_jg10003 [Triparma verrucosa]
MGEPIKKWTPRDILNAELPPHYPACPSDWSDVHPDSITPLSEVYENICDDDVALFNQIRRPKGAWLISVSSDLMHKIITASNKFVTDMGYNDGELIGHNCKKLQNGVMQEDGEWNSIENKKLTDAFKTSSDVNVRLLNFKGDGRPFGNSLTILVLRDKDGSPLYHLGVIKVVAPPVSPSLSSDGNKRSTGSSEESTAKKPKKK